MADFPPDSAAAKVADFKDRPVGVWFTFDDGTAFITPQGGYAVVSPDREPTGHWFGDVTLADGTYMDGGCTDVPSHTEQECEALLNRKEH